ncbi:MAG: hypothetical protein RR100_01945 [Comamonas sp.]
MATLGFTMHIVGRFTSMPLPFTSPQIISFGLWCLTGWVATACVLGSMPSARQALPISSELPAARISTADITTLFTPAGTKPAPTVATVNVKLLGVMLSDHPTQSRVLIQEGTAVPKSFALHATLPGGGKITKIEKRGIELEQGSETLRLQLPP